jgi:hypothetical protein
MIPTRIVFEVLMKALTMHRPPGTPQVESSDNRQLLRLLCVNADRSGEADHDEPEVR